MHSLSIPRRELKLAVMMLMAGFAPYMTYKAISFMGFDMYHSMSAEQEAKSALNRPIPTRKANRVGSAQGRTKSRENTAVLCRA